MESGIAKRVKGKEELDTGSTEIEGGREAEKERVGRGREGGDIERITETRLCMQSNKQK